MALQTFTQFDVTPGIPRSGVGEFPETQSLVPNGVPGIADVDVTTEVVVVVVTKLVAEARVVIVVLTVLGVGRVTSTVLSGSWSETVTVTGGRVVLLDSVETGGVFVARADEVEGVKVAVTTETSTEKDVEHCADRVVNETSVGP
jgi:hypothetical protein